MNPFIYEKESSLFTVKPLDVDMDQEKGIYETFTDPIVDGKWFSRQENLHEETWKTFKSTSLCMGFPILIEPEKRKEGKDANHTVTVDAALVLGHL